MCSSCGKKPRKLLRRATKGQIAHVDFKCWAQQKIKSVLLVSNRKISYKCKRRIKISKRAEQKPILT